MVSSAFRATAAPLAAALIVLSPGTSRPQAGPAAPDDATIVHVLDRTGFGGRPEDVAHVREVGLDHYLDEQLHPERLADAEVRARLAGFETLALDSSAIAERYYAPLLRERRAAKKAAATFRRRLCDGRRRHRSGPRAGRLPELRDGARGDGRTAAEDPRAVTRRASSRMWWTSGSITSTSRGKGRGAESTSTNGAIRPHVSDASATDRRGRQKPGMLSIRQWQSVDRSARR